MSELLQVCCLVSGLGEQNALLLLSPRPMVLPDLLQAEYGAAELAGRQELAAEAAAFLRAPTVQCSGAANLFMFEHTVCRTLS